MDPEVDAEQEPPRELAELLLGALAHGVESVAADGGPLIPFTLTDRGAGVVLDRFWTGELGQSQVEARAWLGTQSALVRACVAWDGYLTVGEDRSDAIYVEGSDASGADGWVVAQRYAQVGVGTWGASGEPLLCGRAEPLFRPATGPGGGG